VFRGITYRSSVNYSKVTVRNHITLTDKGLIKEIERQTDGKILSIDEIIKLSNKITSESLSFTFDKVSNNPNTVYELKKANCVGYAALFSAVGNYIIRKQNQTDKYVINHVVGELDFLGFKLHGLFNDPFYKTHDFNEIIDKKTGEKKYIDPSLRDYFRIEYVTCE